MAEAAKGNGKKGPPQAMRGGNRWRLLDAAKNRWSYLTDDDTTMKDIERPGFFDLVYRDLRPRDDIELETLNGRKRWLYTVLDCGIGWAVVHKLAEWDLPASTHIDRDVLEGFEFHKDPVDQTWFAVRKVDRQELGRLAGLKSKQDLVRFIEGHATVRAR